LWLKTDFLKSLQEQIKEACQRASWVEEVARDRRRQMLVELNSHCKIPVSSRYTMFGRDDLL
jgi:DNA-binding LytR/AlgR family response regulator